ncbi:MAG: hypothetical protein V4642_15135 [Bacteroidota bacterium]
MNSDVKKFLLKTLVFLLPLALVFGYFEVRLRAMETTYSTKKRDFTQQMDSVEILVLGSSHALYGIDPSQFSLRSYNLSNSSQTLYYDEKLAEKYLDNMPLLKAMIIPVSYFSLWYELEDTKDAWRVYFYKHFWGIESPGMQTFDSENFSYIMMYSPEIAWFYARRGFQDTNVTGSVRPNGWIAATGHEVDQLTDSLAKVRVGSHDRVHFENRLPQNIRNLENFIQLLKKRNIEPVFITTPVSELYAKFARPQVVLKNEAIMKELSKKHNCQYFNYFRDARFTLEDFNDNDHLNPRGAVKFSRILNEEAILKRKLWN